MKRKNLLKDLVQLNNYKKAYLDLYNYEWDCEEALYVITDAELKQSLLKFKEENLIHELESWANMIECRDDLEYESEQGKQTIEKLANPELYGSTNEVLEKALSN